MWCCCFQLQRAFAAVQKSRVSELCVSEHAAVSLTLWFQGKLVNIPVYSPLGHYPHEHFHAILSYLQQQLQPEQQHPSVGCRVDFLQHANNTFFVLAMSVPRMC